MCSPAGQSLENCDLQNYVVAATSLVIRKQASRTSEAAGLIREGKTISACQTEHKETIDGATDYWFRLDEGRGFVFGGFLARPAVNEREPWNDRVFTFNRKNKSLLYIMRTTSPEPCKVEVERGIPVFFEAPESEKYLLISPGTSNTRDILILDQSSCRIVWEDMGMIDDAGWQGEVLKYERSELIENGCLRTEFEFRDGKASPTGKQYDAGPGTEC
jgi:hypothetical protein